MNDFIKATKKFFDGFNEPDKQRSETEIEYDISKAERDLEGEKVNHILHLLLTILTGGLWIIVWIFTVLNASGGKSVAENQLKELSKEKDKLKNPPKRKTKPLPFSEVRKRAVAKSEAKNLSKSEETELKNNSTTDISLSQELANLNKLKESGILSEEEYKVAKMKVLS